MQGTKHVLATRKMIAILEADLHYNNNINIVYNDTDNVLTNKR